MKKIVFCNIAYMKYYCGSTEEDTPMNGGKYIGENKDGGEAITFWIITANATAISCPTATRCILNGFPEIMMIFLTA